MVDNILNESPIFHPYIEILYSSSPQPLNTLEIPLDRTYNYFNPEIAKLYVNSLSRTYTLAKAFVSECSQRRLYFEVDIDASAPAREHFIGPTTHGLLGLNSIMVRQLNPTEGIEQRAIRVLEAFDKLNECPDILIPKYLCDARVSGGVISTAMPPASSITITSMGSATITPPAITGSSSGFLAALGAP